MPVGKSITADLHYGRFTANSNSELPLGTLVVIVARWMRTGARLIQMQRNGKSQLPEGHSERVNRRDILNGPYVVTGPLHVLVSEPLIAHFHELKAVRTITDDKIEVLPVRCQVAVILVSGTDRPRPVAANPG